MKEEWRPFPIPELSDYYEVSSSGRVRSKSRVYNITRTMKSSGLTHTRRYRLKGRILSQVDTGNSGYYQVFPSLEGKSYSIPVHRAVALAFIPNPENKPEVNHIDGNKHNNCVTNLEWATRDENHHHARENGLYDWKRHQEACANHFGMAVYCKETNKIYNSQTQASRELNISQGGVCDSIHKQRSVNGYTFIKASDLGG